MLFKQDKSILLIVEIWPEQLVATYVVHGHGPAEEARGMNNHGTGEIRADLYYLAERTIPWPHALENDPPTIETT